MAFHFRTHTLLVALAAAQSAAHDAAQSYALSQCAIVQLGTIPRLYLALPDSALAAVDVRSGALLWRTKKAAYPLMARNDRLLAVLPPPPAGQGWRLAVLDARSGRILARLPVWGAGSGTLEAGLGSSTTMEAVSRDGRDFVVWRSTVQAVSGVVHPIPPPTYTTTGAAEVDLLKASLVPTSEEVPGADNKYHANPEAGYHFGPFDVDGVTLVAAREFRDGRFKIVLHRTRGDVGLPDVELCEPSRNSDYVGVSADRRYILGGCQDPKTTRRYSYDVVVYTSVAGEKVGELLSDAWPGSSAVWRDRLLFFTPDRVEGWDLSTGRKLFQRSVRNLSYRGPYPPAAAPPRR